MATGASFESFEKELTRLAGIFERGLAEFKGPGYVEAQLRDDFLNPFFRALGWDLENRAGRVQTKREVEIESRTEIGGRKNRADYLFRTDGHDRFICEAKKPHGDIATTDNYSQTIRHGWSRSTPIGVLHDLERLQIVDMQITNTKDCVKPGG